MRAQRHTPHPTHINGIPWSWLNEEKWRLVTYVNYPQSAPKFPVLLAASGFAYTGTVKDHDGMIVCCFCDLNTTNWQDSDNIAEVHRELSPNCPMVTNLNCPNIPFNGQHQQLPDDLHRNTGALQTVTLAHSLTTASVASTTVKQTNVTPNQNTSVGSASCPTSSDFQSTPPVSLTVVNQTALEPNHHTVVAKALPPAYSHLGVVIERLKRPDYTQVQKRLETFDSWPRDHQLSPDQLADAGFYYAGYGDCVRCFNCGGSLRNWTDDNDVWVEHARWFPKCAYLRQQMGQVVVDTVQQLSQTHVYDSTEPHCSEVEQSVKVEELPGPPSGSSLPEQVKISSTLDERTELEEGDQNFRDHSSHNAQPLVATASDTWPVQELSHSATDTRLVQESSHSATDTRLVQEPSESTEAFVYSESASLHTLPPTDLVMSLLAEQQSQNNRGDDYRLTNLVCRSLRITRRICATQDNTFDPTIIDINPQEPSLQNTEAVINASSDLSSS